MPPKSKTSREPSGTQPTLDGFLVKQHRAEVSPGVGAAAYRPQSTVPAPTRAPPPQQAPPASAVAAVAPRGQGIKIQTDRGPAPATATTPAAAGLGPSTTASWVTHQDPVAPQRAASTASAVGPSTTRTTVVETRPSATSRASATVPRYDAPRRAPPLCTYYHSAKGCYKGTACPALHFDDWTHAVVRAPWSRANVVIHPVYGIPLCMWDRIVAHLGDTHFQPQTAVDVEDLFIGLLPPDAEHRSMATSCNGLAEVLTNMLSPAEQHAFYTKTLPWMRRTVLNAPALFPKGIVPLLPQGATNKITITDTQAATLVCCAFFSLFPERHRTREPWAAHGHYTAHGSKGANAYGATLPAANFGFLLDMTTPPSLHKIRCLIEYFAMRCEMEEQGAASTAIEFIRTVSRHAPGGAALRHCDAPIAEAVLSDKGAIEDFTGRLEVDFANMMLGGGVIGRGCVQEEIRFTICPELFAARMVCPAMLPNECVFACGVRRYTNYTGYSDTFQYAGRYEMPAGTLVRNLSGALMYNVSIVAMDATNFRHGNLSPIHQYSAKWIAKDADKALVAFTGSDRASLPAVSHNEIVTGNWGCGAFGGDSELKFLIQLCAASAVGRPLVYLTFGDADLSARLAGAHALIREAGMRVCDLYLALEKYAENRVQQCDPVPDPTDSLLAAFEWGTEEDLSSAAVVSPPAPAFHVVSVLHHLQQEIEDTA